MKFSTMTAVCMSLEPITPLGELKVGTNARTINVPLNIKEFDSKEAYVTFVSELAGKMYDAMAVIFEEKKAKT